MSGGGVSVSESLALRIGPRSDINAGQRGCIPHAPVAGRYEEQIEGRRDRTQSIEEEK